MLGYEPVSPSGATDVTEQVLQHEAADARARVQRGQDEQRLEHDREVVPERHHALAAERMREDLRHPDRERRRAAGARIERRLADLRGQLAASAPSLTAKPHDDDLRAGGGAGADHAGRAVDREVDARLEQHGGDHRHDRDERFHQHGAVSDHAARRSRARASWAWCPRRSARGSPRSRRTRS